jgi:hypothetical protein
MLIEDGLETRQLPAESLFTPPALQTVETPLAITKLLQEVKGAGSKSMAPVGAPLAASRPPVPPQVIEPVLLTQHATAFGAQ